MSDEAGSHMRECLSTTHIFKRSVACGACNQSYLFTLDAIAHVVALKCPACGNDINLADPAYSALRADVTASIRDLRAIEKSA
jgi:hypothetical protein